MLHNPAALCLFKLLRTFKNLSLRRRPLINNHITTPHKHCLKINLSGALHIEQLAEICLF